MLNDFWIPSLAFIETYKGSVNRWECDENDHQNVRFYLAKLNQGLAIALQAFGLTNRHSAAQLLANTRTLHIRFLREARLASPQMLQCGLLEVTPGDELKIVSILTNTLTQEASASFITTIDIQGFALPPLTHSCVNLPELAQPRGVRDEPSRYSSISRAVALECGFAEIGAGSVSTNECSWANVMDSAAIMGRFSDGMPNLWAQFSTQAEMDARSNGSTGGAVLEYRMQFHQPLMPQSTFSHLAGIHELGNKTQSICHLMFGSTNHQLAVSAEALAISMDWTTRKSIAIPAERRQRIEALKLQPPPR